MGAWSCRLPFSPPISLACPRRGQYQRAAPVRDCRPRPEVGPHLWGRLCSSVNRLSASKLSTKKLPRPRVVRRNCDAIVFPPTAISRTLPGLGVRRHPESESPGSTRLAPHTQYGSIVRAARSAAAPVGGWPRHFQGSGRPSVFRVGPSAVLGRLLGRSSTPRQPTKRRAPNPQPGAAYAFPMLPVFPSATRKHPPTPPVTTYSVNLVERTAFPRVLVKWPDKRDGAAPRAVTKHDAARRCRGLPGVVCIRVEATAGIEQLPLVSVYLEDDR